MFNSQIIVDFVDGHSVTSLTVAPTSTNVCDGTYTRVVSIPKSCDLLRKTTYKEWKDTTGDANLMTLSIGNRDIIMMPFLTGCMTITTEMIYE